MKHKNTRTITVLLALAILLCTIFIASCDLIRPQEEVITSPITEKEKDFVISNSSSVSSTIEIDTIRLYTDSAALATALAELEANQQVVMAYTEQNSEVNMIDRPQLYYVTATSAISENSALALLNIIPAEHTEAVEIDTSVVLKATACQSLAGAESCLEPTDVGTQAYWITEEGQLTDAETTLFLYTRKLAKGQSDCHATSSWYCQILTSASEDTSVQDNYTLYNTNTQIQVDAAITVLPYPITKESFLPGQEVAGYLNNLPEDSKLLFAYIVKKAVVGQPTIELQHTPDFATSVSTLDETTWVNYGSLSVADNTYRLMPFKVTPKECSFTSPSWGCDVPTEDVDYAKYFVQTPDGINAISSCPECTIIDSLCEKCCWCCGTCPVMVAPEMSSFEGGFRNELINELGEGQEPLLEPER